MRKIREKDQIKLLDLQLRIQIRSRRDLINNFLLI